MLDEHIFASNEILSTNGVVRIELKTGKANRTHVRINSLYKNIFPKKIPNDKLICNIIFYYHRF